ncbi:MAG: HAMP domain-containing histidine kinase [Alphaproteobacteria bacterium]|nr:HAMP domain-containing histidine kinase [Alphaproteobacteria bacterium]
MLIQKNKTHKASVNRSLWFRLISYSVVWTLFALILGGYLLSLTFKETIENNFDARLNGLLENLIGVSDSISEGEITFYRTLTDSRFEQPYSGWYWQISAEDEETIRSRSLWDQKLDPDLGISASQTRYSRAIGPEDQKLRRVERDITLPGDDKTVYRFIVAIDRSEIDEQLDRFDNILIYSLGALGIGLIAASLLQVFLGLKPLRNIRLSLLRIRTGEDAHLPDDFPMEIQPLADEMNALLDHNNQIVERSRTQVGNLAHALKTPLAVLMNESERHPGQLSEVVSKQANIMRRQVDHYLRRARVAASTKVITSRTEVWTVLNDMCRVMAKIHRDKNLTMLPTGGDDQSRLYFRGERQDLEEMVGNLIENAAKWADSKVIASCQRKGDHILIQVIDDGPGIDRKVREAVFIRGERLDENTPGTGLGLSIVKDLAGLYGGEITLTDNEPHGLHVRLILPAAVTNS